MEVVHVRDFFESRIIRAQFRQLGVNRGPDGGSQVGRAKGEEAEPPMPREFQFLPNFGNCFNKPGVHGRQVPTLFHRYQTHVILLVAPDEKSFRFVKKYSSAWKTDVERWQEIYVRKGKLFLFDKVSGAHNAGSRAVKKYFYRSTFPIFLIMRRIGRRYGIVTTF